MTPGSTPMDKICRAWEQGGLSRVAGMAWARAWHPVVRRWSESWVTRRNGVIALQRRLMRRPVVHAIGDSHTHVLRGISPFVVTWLGSATAFNLGKPGSSTGSSGKLEAALRAVDKSRDVVLLVLGEIDTRIHVYLQYVRRGGACSFEQIIDEIIERYGAVILRLASQGYKVVVQSVPAVPRQGNIYDVEHYADDAKRAVIVRVFNEALSRWCRDHGVDYLDLYSVVSDERGFILDGLTDDGTHLNAAALPLYAGWVRSIEGVARKS